MTVAQQQLLPLCGRAQHRVDPGQTGGTHQHEWTATEAIDKLHTTAESHHRIMIVEVMGRLSGWIAMYAGLAAGAPADYIPQLATVDPERFAIAAVTTDVLTGEEAVVKHGSVADAVRASIAIPGMFTPFVSEGRVPDSSEILTWLADALAAE